MSFIKSNIFWIIISVVLFIAGMIFEEFLDVSKLNGWKWTFEVVITPVLTLTAILIGLSQFKKQLNSDNEKLIESHSQQFKANLFSNVVDKIILNDSLNGKCQNNIKRYIDRLEELIDNPRASVPLALYACDINDKCCEYQNSITDIIMTINCHIIVHPKLSTHLRRITSQQGILSRLSKELFMDTHKVLPSSKSRPNRIEELTVAEYQTMKCRAEDFKTALLNIARRTSAFDRDMQTIMLGKMFNNTKPLHPDSIIKE